MTENIPSRILKVTEQRGFELQQHAAYQQQQQQHAVSVGNHDGENIEAENMS